MKIIENFIGSIIDRLFPNAAADRKITILQFIKFGIVGLSNTILSYVLYLLVLFILKPYNLFFDAYIASIVSFVLSVLWSFVWNNRFVFKSEKGERNIFKALIKTYISYGFTGFLLANALLYLWINVLKIPKEVAPLISLIITVPTNFILNKFWAFKTKGKSNSEKDNEVTK